MGPGRIAGAAAEVRVSESRPPRRRRPASDLPADPGVAEVPGEPAAPAAAPAAEPPRARVPTDLGALQAVADLDRAQLDALMAEFSPRKGGAGPRKGDRVRAVVSRVTGSTVFVDVGGKADGAVDRLDFSADVAVGDVVELYVVGTKDGELRLTRSLGGDATRDMLDEARANGIPIQGKVGARNEGGFEVLLSGNVRAFCPVSHIDVHADEAELDTYVGRTLAFRVIDLRGRDVVVSHRAIAAEEARADQGRRLAEMQVGSVHDGTVVTLRDFGAFVRLANGLEGLVHISNIGDRRVKHPSEALTEGQAVRVRVLAVDAARKRVDLGMRQVDAPVEAEPGAAPAQAGSFGTLGALLAGVQVRKKK